jgi:uncharacterized membrane protein YciS (DUF1049 family)
MVIIRWIFAVIVFVIVMLVAFTNSQVVEFNFFDIFVWKQQLALMLFVVFAIGVALGLVAMSMQLLSSRRQIRRLKKQVLAVERERDEARSQNVPSLLGSSTVSDAPDSTPSNPRQSAYDYDEGANTVPMTQEKSK